MRLFDSHAHYFDDRFFGAECPEGADVLLSRLFGAGELCGIINVGTDIPSTERALAQADRYPHMYVAAGIHPSDSRHYPDMEAELALLRALLSRRRDKIVAIGEIGLDYHYPETDKEAQARWLHAQLALAQEYDLPVVIHDREAHGDSFDAVCAHPHVRGVFHSYSGSTEMAKELIRRGWYISFSGTITFKNATKIAAVAAEMPRDSVLIETDCPYLAPHPHRGSLNHSGMLSYTAARLGELWGISGEEAAAITAHNAETFFFGGKMS